MKWKVMGWLVLVASVVFLVVAVAFDKKDEKEKPTTIPLAQSVPKGSSETTIDTLKEGPNKVDVPTKAAVHVIEGGWLRLSNNEELTVTTGSIKDAIPSDARFVLVPDTLELTENELNKLRSAIDDNQTVLFYGKKVDAKRALKLLGVEGEPIVLESNATLHNFLYGYGYSEEYGALMHVFSPSNSLEEATLTSYVQTFLFNKRGY